MKIEVRKVEQIRATLLPICPIHAPCDSWAHCGRA